MYRKIRQLTLACALIAASQFTSLSSAKAETIDLVCVNNGVSFNYWINTANNTVIMPGLASGGVAENYLMYPVHITALAYDWFYGGKNGVHYSIDRTTGLLTAFFPNGTVTAKCSKGSTPPPEPKL
ncbi:MAG TPA: hypothetical protein VNF99_06425 [Stellaceae bacterium]|nr:hypothetical protein [Stellaceae bacterium]